MTAPEAGAPAARVLVGDALERLRELPDGSVHCCVTSPPYYGLRSYLPDGDPAKPLEVGREPTPEAYAARLAAVFREVRRVLRPDGTLWLVLGDSYGRGDRVRWDGDGHRGRNKRQAWVGYPSGAPEQPAKQLLGIPWRVAFALQDDGWILRSDIVWAKPAALPEPVRDRPTRAHEFVFLFAKQLRYYYDADAIKEPATYAGTVIVYDGDEKNARHPNRMAPGKRQGMVVVGEWRNRRDVWTVPSERYPGAHFATFPEALVEPMVLAGCPPGGTVLDPFCGSGTTLAVAVRLGRSAVGIELNPGYVPLIERRLAEARVRQTNWLHAAGDGTDGAAPPAGR